MKRKEFLRKLGIGAGAVIIAPKVVANFKTINSKENYTEGLIPVVSKTPTSSFPCRKPCLGDKCIDNKGKAWVVKGRENRIGYGLPDMSQIILIPAHLKPNQKPIDFRERVSIYKFNKEFTMISCRNKLKL